MTAQTGQWKWPVCGQSVCPVCVQTGHADRTLKMARLPVLSAKKLGKSCWRGTNDAVASFRSCWRFSASSSLRFASLTLHDLVHQTADKKTVAYFHTRTLFWVCHLTHYTTYVLHSISTVYLPISSVGHWWDRQMGHFQYVPSFSDPSVMCSKDRKRTFSIVPFTCSRWDR